MNPTLRVRTTSMSIVLLSPGWISHFSCAMLPAPSLPAHAGAVGDSRYIATVDGFTIYREWGGCKPSTVRIPWIQGAVRENPERARTDVARRAASAAARSARHTTEPQS